MVRYFIEECGLSVDELTPDGLHTPLSFICTASKTEEEERMLPVVRYLLAQGANITHRITPNRTLAQVTLGKGNEQMQ